MSEWIEVERRIPEYNQFNTESDPVLVCTENNTYLILVIVKVKVSSQESSWQWAFANGKDLYHTILPKYWMPLPELPKGII